MRFRGSLDAAERSLRTLGFEFRSDAKFDHKEGGNIITEQEREGIL